MHQLQEVRRRVQELTKGKERTERLEMLDRAIAAVSTGTESPKLIELKDFVPRATPANYSGRLAESDVLRVVDSRRTRVVVRFRRTGKECVRPLHVGGVTRSSFADRLFEQRYAGDAP